MRRFTVLDEKRAKGLSRGPAEVVQELFSQRVLGVRQDGTRPARVRRTSWFRPGAASGSSCDQTRDHVHTVSPPVVVAGVGTCRLP